MALIYTDPGNQFQMGITFRSSLLIVMPVKLGRSKVLNFAIFLSEVYAIVFICYVLKAMSYIVHHVHG